MTRGNTFGISGARALTVKPAWAWLIMQGIKDVESRKCRGLPRKGVCVVTCTKGYSKADHARVLGELREIAPGAEKAMPPYAALKALCGKALGSVNYEVLDESDSRWYRKGCIPWRLTGPIWFKEQFDVTGKSRVWHMGLADANQSVALM